MLATAAAASFVHSATVTPIFAAILWVDSISIVLFSVGHFRCDSIGTHFHFDAVIFRSQNSRRNETNVVFGMSVPYIFVDLYFLKRMFFFISL